jgi:magnesium transporter
MATARPEAEQALLQQPLWIDLEEPTPDEMAAVATRFGFHPLAVEDALDARDQRPKLDWYDGYRYMVFYSFDAPQDAPRVVEPIEINIFWSDDYIVTVHHRPASALQEARRRWNVGEPRAGATTTALLHVILDAAVDSVLPVIDAISDHCEQLEDRVFHRTNRRLTAVGQHLRRQLVTLRRILMPERDVIVAIQRDPKISGDTEARRYFDDIYDHLMRAAEAVDNEREIVTGVMETYVTTLSNNVNEVVKTLTIASILLMSMSLIAGIYGMNFEHMPELDWRLGYPLALAMMAAVAAGLLLYFRSRRWL